MKTFNFKHLFFDTEEIHIDGEMPGWLTCKENRWFLDSHVMTLAVGQSVDTDFHRIIRVE